MFREDLQKRMEKIFGFGKTTFNAPSDAFEQDTLFIDITSSPANAGEGKISARVEGTLTVYAQEGKLPFGHMSKRIAKAPALLTKPLFFFDIDEDVAASPARLQNISERRTRFVFLYSAQYDPNQGELNEVVFEGEE